MPAPQTATLYNTAILKFQSFQIQLPATPVVQVPLTRLSAQPISKVSAPAPSGPELFRPASSRSQDIDRQRQLNSQYAKLFQGMSTGIVAAWQLFHAFAILKDVLINGPTAVAGQILCPNLEMIVVAQSIDAGTGLQEMEIRKQVAKTFWTNWQQTMNTVIVPGLPWYPSFVAVPSPVAPPTPNTPMPFAALTRNSLFMTKSWLTMGLTNALQGKLDYSGQFSEALATSIESVFNQWVLQTMVTQVLGTGPVPTFAPPYVPVGPVVGGTGTMVPGGFV